jgi:hypothetical protein
MTCDCYSGYQFSDLNYFQMSYIIDAIRTPIGNFGGTLSSVRTDDLAALPII